jgi:hypothetical protein
VVGGSASAAWLPPLAVSAVDAFSLSEIHVRIHTLEGYSIRGWMCEKSSFLFMFFF